MRNRPSVARHYWLIDEVTAVKEWSAVIKDLRDNTELRDDCVVLTGSSARDFREATKNLAGRRGGITDGDRLLLPMDFRAFCAAIGLGGVPQPGPFLPRDLMSREAGNAFDDLEVWSGQLIDAWENYLLVGGYPRAVRDFLDHGDIQDDFIHDIWDVIRGDVIRATSLSDTEIIALLARIGESISSRLNATSVARDAGLGNHHRVDDRINDLFFSFLAWRVYQNKNGRPNPRAQRKVYFADPLIARIANHLNHHHARPDDTKLSEQQLGLALARAIEAQRSGSFLAADGILYERTPSENEIDFVSGELELRFESKYVDDNWKREAQTAEASYGRGILATRSIFERDDSVWAVPAPLVAWLI
jgi:uncharacterized protein